MNCIFRLWTRATYSLVQRSVGTHRNGLSRGIRASFCTKKSPEEILEERVTGKIKTMDEKEKNEEIVEENKTTVNELYKLVYPRLLTMSTKQLVDVLKTFSYYGFEQPELYDMAERNLYKKMHLLTEEQTLMVMKSFTRMSKGSDRLYMLLEQKVLKNIATWKFLSICTLIEYFVRSQRGTRRLFTSFQFLFVRKADEIPLVELVRAARIIVFAPHWKDHERIEVLEMTYKRVDKRLETYDKEGLIPTLAFLFVEVKKFLAANSLPQQHEGEGQSTLHNDERQMKVREVKNLLFGKFSMTHPATTSANQTQQEIKPPRKFEDFYRETIKFQDKFEKALINLLNKSDSELTLSEYLSLFATFSSVSREVPKVFEEKFFSSEVTQIVKDLKPTELHTVLEEILGCNALSSEFRGKFQKEYSRYITEFVEDMSPDEILDFWQYVDHYQIEPTKHIPLFKEKLSASVNLLGFETLLKTTNLIGKSKQDSKDVQLLENKFIPALISAFKREPLTERNIVGTIKVLLSIPSSKASQYLLPVIEDITKRGVKTYKDYVAFRVSLDAIKKSQPELLENVAMLEQELIAVYEESPSHIKGQLGGKNGLEDIKKDK